MQAFGVCMCGGYVRACVDKWVRPFTWVGRWARVCARARVQFPGHRSSQRLYDDAGISSSLLTRTRTCRGHSKML